MDKDHLDNIYLSLQGQLIPEAAVPWVPNLFLPGSPCDTAYACMRSAYGRLCQRLGVDIDDEDEDLNCMVDALEHIQEILCKEMFRLGIEYTALFRREGE